MFHRRAAGVMTTIRWSGDESDPLPLQQRCVQCGLIQDINPNRSVLSPSVDVCKIVCANDDLSKEPTNSEAAEYEAEMDVGNSIVQSPNAHRMYTSQQCVVCQFPLPWPHLMYSTGAESYLPTKLSESETNSYLSAIGDGAGGGGGGLLPNDLVKLVFGYLIWIPPGVGEVVEVLESGFKYYVALIVGKRQICDEAGAKLSRSHGVVNSTIGNTIFKCRYLGWKVGWQQSIEMFDFDAIAGGDNRLRVLSPKSRGSSAFGDFSRIEAFGVRTPAASKAGRGTAGIPPPPESLVTRRYEVYTGSLTDLDRQVLHSNDGFSYQTIAAAFRDSKWSGAGTTDLLRARRAQQIDNEDESPNATVAGGDEKSPPSESIFPPLPPDTATSNAANQSSGATIQRPITDMEQSISKALAAAMD